MSKRKFFLRVMCVLMCFMLLMTDISAFATVLPFETQYDYDEADIAWLTDLVIKEDMTTVEGMAERVTLVPQPDYPYTETPESFSDEVDYFVSLYSLDAGAQRAGYIYFFEVLNSNSTVLSADASDEDIREYLEAMGIEYPANVGADELVMARALFTALVTGALNSSFFPVGSDLEGAVVSYLAVITGMNISSLEKWLDGKSVLSLDEYILAASKLTLWSNGYDVTKDTPEDEVYRLMAAMTVKAQGISVDSNLSFDELKAQYIAALLGAKYSVSLDPDKLSTHLKNDTTAFYILQLMGKTAGLSIREDNATYEKAFSLVAENTGIFDVTSEDFYADIKEYSAVLNTRCKSLWVYPTAYATDSSYSCIVSVNGVTVKNNYYNEVAIDPDKKEQDLVIKVTVSGGGKSSVCVYTVHITQGTYENVQGDAPVTGNSGADSFVSGDSLVTGILSSIGVNSVISAVLDSSYSTLPVGLSGIVSFIAPTFDGGAAAVTDEEAEQYSDDFFISVLDEIGSLVDADIEGIPGLSMLENIEYKEDNFITFG